jgi:hypothetical protein
VPHDTTDDPGGGAAAGRHARLASGMPMADLLVAVAAARAVARIASRTAATRCR